VDVNTDIDNKTYMAQLEEE